MDVDGGSGFRPYNRHHPPSQGFDTLRRDARLKESGHTVIICKYNKNLSLAVTQKKKTKQNMTNGSLMQIECIAECSILQYF